MSSVESSVGSTDAFEIPDDEHDVYGVYSGERQLEKRAVEWKTFESSRAYECHVVLCPEKTGFSIYAATLPGVVSQGETEEESIANIREALQGTIETYLEGVTEIPWTKEIETPPDGAKERWILVNV